jgi:hypothetical protein
MGESRLVEQLFVLLSLLLALLKVSFQSRLRQSHLLLVLVLNQNHRWMNRSFLVQMRQMLEPRLLNRIHHLLLLQIRLSFR